MKHARKMKLVDVNTAEASESTVNLTNVIKTTNELPGDTNHDALSFLDQHMAKILESNNLSDFDKWTQYNQALIRYLYWLKEKNNDSVNNHLKKVIDDFRKTRNNSDNDKVGSNYFNLNSSRSSLSDSIDSDDFFLTKTSFDQTLSDPQLANKSSDNDSNVKHKFSNTTFRKGMKAKAKANNKPLYSKKSKFSNKTKFNKETADLIFQNWDKILQS